MTSATSAPVIMPSMATPNRISNQPTTRPPGEVTKSALPCPRTVAIPQLNESNSDSIVFGFSSSVIRIAAMATVPRIPSPRVMKNRRSSCPPTRRMCHATRRMIGLVRIGTVRFGIGPIVPHRPPSPPVADPDAPPYAVGGSVLASGSVTSTTSASSAATRSAGVRWRLTPWAPPPIATPVETLDRGVGDDRPWSRRPERRDRAALVAGDRVRLRRVGERQAPDAEVGAHLRPVEATAAGHEHEQVVVLAAADDDGPQQRPERDALELRALLGAVGTVRPDDAVRDTRRVECLDRRRSLGHARRVAQERTGSR